MSKNTFIVYAIVRSIGIRNTFFILGGLFVFAMIYGSILNHQKEEDKKFLAGEEKEAKRIADSLTHAILNEKRKRDSINYTHKHKHRVNKKPHHK